MNSRNKQQNSYRDPIGNSILFLNADGITMTLNK